MKKILDKITSILEEVESVNARLDEGISPKEKQQVNDLINKKKAGHLKFDGLDITVNSSTKEMMFIYTGNRSDDFTFLLTDIADARGLQFKYDKISKKHVFAIKL